MTTYICEYCLKQFSSKSVLVNHVLTAKYCINKRTKENTKEPKETKKTRKPEETKNPREIINTKFDCKDCKREFAKKQSIASHILVCTAKIKNDYENKLIHITRDYENKLKLLTNEHEHRIVYLQEEIQKKDLFIKEITISAVSRSTTTNTNNKTNITTIIQNLQPITDDDLKNNVQYLTIDHIKKGAVGYGEFASDFSFKDKLVCSDFSRKKVKYKDVDGNVITDPEMIIISKKFFESIKDKNSEIISKFIKESDISLENKKKHIRELSTKTNMDIINLQQTSELLGYNTEINIGASGEKTMFHNNFVKTVCSLSIKE